MTLTRYPNSVVPLRLEHQFAAERALLMVLPQIDHMRKIQMKEYIDKFIIEKIQNGDTQLTRADGVTP